MGEAKRRTAAQPSPAAPAGQLTRRLAEAFADLLPAPMKGATALDLSPGDYERVMQAVPAKGLTVGVAGLALDGIAIQESPLLVDGVMIGRDRDGKAVWSNQPWMQEAIDANFAPWW